MAEKPRSWSFRTIRPRTANRGRTGPATNLRVDTTIPVIVRDASDYPVTDLSRDSFRLFEDGVEHTAQSFSRQDGPASIGFIVDASGSMEKRIVHSFAAVVHFLGTQVAGDEWFLIRFSDNPTSTTPFTRDPDEIRRALSSIRCGGWTALNDAIYLGLNERNRARNSRKVLIVLTDGGDNHSTYSHSELTNLVRESDLRIYSIGLFAKPDLLEKIGREIGGRALCSHTAADMPGVVEKLSNLFRSEYVLGYVPKYRGNDEKYRHVRVQLDDTTGGWRLNVSWRREYSPSTSGAFGVQFEPKLDSFRNRGLDERDSVSNKIGDVDPLRSKPGFPGIRQHLLRQISRCFSRRRDIAKARAVTVPPAVRHTSGSLAPGWS